MPGPLFKPGDRCGDLAIVGLIGQGGFAEVYEVEDAAGARRALKTLATDADSRPKLRARLAQEGTALAMIDHPNVVRFFGAFFQDDRVFLVLELVRGHNLREALRAAGGRPDPAMVVRWIQQAAAGVAAAHAAGVVHRDLKPENILITPEGEAKVIDFGIAKLSSFGVKTTDDQKVGTAMYMPPEQIQGAPPDPRMDVYALGLLLYEALAGAHPIVRGPATVIEICARQLTYRPPPLAAVAPWVPPALAAIVDRAVDKDPARRPASMAGFAVVLGDVFAGPRADTTTPLIATSVGTTARALGDTARLEVTAAAPAIATAPLPVVEPARPARTPIPARRPRLSAAAVAAAAIVIGLCGGAWLMNWTMDRLLR